MTVPDTFKEFAREFMRMLHETEESEPVQPSGLEEMLGAMFTHHPIKAGLFGQGVPRLPSDQQENMMVFLDAFQESGDDWSTASDLRAMLGKEAQALLRLVGAPKEWMAALEVTLRLIGLLDGVRYTDAQRILWIANNPNGDPTRMPRGAGGTNLMLSHGRRGIMQTFCVKGADGLWRLKPGIRLTPPWKRSEDNPPGFDDPGAWADQIDRMFPGALDALTVELDSDRQTLAANEALQLYQGRTHGNRLIWNGDEHFTWDADGGGWMGWDYP